jgi:hypothetical protein
MLDVTKTLKRWRGRFTRNRLVGAAASAVFALGTAVALATFTFQTAQVWVDESNDRRGLRWQFPAAVATITMLAFVAGYLLYWILRSRPLTLEADPYRKFVDGVISYARVLHSEHRDPALLRLRNNTSLTLHVLGFHAERVTLGTLALESAQFTDNKLDIIAILIDDLGWGNHLLGKSDTAIRNIEKAIRFGEQLDTGYGSPQRELLLAKAYRHLGVITTIINDKLDESHFMKAKELLKSIKVAPREARVDLAHVAHAEALAIASMLGVNQRGHIRKGDSAGIELLRRALALARQAREGFNAEGDQGRFAKSLVLEVRILEALEEDEEARQLSPVRDRAVAASVWARPDGAAFITGR